MINNNTIVSILTNIIMFKFKTNYLNSTYGGRGVSRETVTLGPGIILRDEYDFIKLFNIIILNKFI